MIWWCIMICHVWYMFDSMEKTNYHQNMEGSWNRGSVVVTHGLEPPMDLFCLACEASKPRCHLVHSADHWGIEAKQPFETVYGLWASQAEIYQGCFAILIGSPWLFNYSEIYIIEYILIPKGFQPGCIISSELPLVLEILLFPLQ